jgi:hypothetical protein
MLIIRSDVPEYKCVKRDHHIGIRHLCKITYCRILFTTEKKLTEIWGSSSLLPRFCNLSHLLEKFSKSFLKLEKPTGVATFGEEDSLAQLAVMLLTI